MYWDNTQKRNSGAVNQLAEDYTERRIFILYIKKGTYYTCFVSKQTSYLQVNIH